MSTLSSKIKGQVQRDIVKFFKGQTDRLSNGIVTINSYLS